MTMVSSAPILVLDDDRNVAALMVELLKLEGYRATAMHTVASAIESVESIRPAAVLVDLELQGGSGIDFAKHMRATYGTDVPLIALTAWDERESQAVELASLCARFFAKPAKWPSLLSSVKTLAGRPQ